MEERRWSGRRTVTKPEGRGAAVGWFKSSLPHVKCPNCETEIDMSQFGRGDERVQSAGEIKRQQSRDKIADANQSTRPGEITLAELQGRRRG